MANTYGVVGTGVFEIDTSADVADLTALKGSPPASTDILYSFDSACVDINEDMDILWTHIGDNQAGDRPTKEGFIDVQADVALTYHHTVNNGGLYGVGLTSRFRLLGTSADHRAKIVGNTVKPGLYYMIQPYVESTWGHIYNFRAGIVSINSNSTFVDTLVENNSYGFLFAGGASRKYLPASILRTRFVNCVYGWCDLSTFGADLETYLIANDVSFEGGATQESHLNIGFGSGGGAKAKYIYYTEADNSIIAPPSWDSTAGVQALAANDNLTLSASWNGATHANGDNVFYRIYIRADAAPDSFGEDSEYFLAETTNENFIIASYADGSVLKIGSDVHVIIRAVTKISGEDDNTTSLNTVVAGEGGNYLRCGSRLTN